MNASRRTLRFGFVAMAALAIVSCTLLGSRDLTQCTKNADCATSQYANAVCQGGICVGGGQSQNDATSVTDTSTTDTSDVQADTNQPVVTCTTTDECVPLFDVPALCVDNQCRTLVNIETDHGCEQIYPSDQTYRGEGVTIIGAYLNSGFQGSPTPAMKAFSQAIKDIKDNAGARIVAIVCDKAKNQAKKAFDHLAALKIPLFVGQFEHSDLIAITAEAKTKDMAVWSTLVNDEGLRSQAANTEGYVSFLLDDLTATAPGWQGAFDIQQDRRNPIPPPIQDAGEDVDAAVPRAPTRVALVYTHAPENDKLVEMLTGTGASAGSPALLVNGASLASATTDTFRTVRLEPDTVVTKELFSSFAIPYKPHLILGVGGDQIHTAYRLIETEVYSSNFPSNQRPAWVFSSPSKYNLVTGTNVFTTTSERNRVLGIDFTGDKVLFNAFAEIIEGPAGSSLRAQAQSFNVLYDAVFAASLAANAPVDGGRPPRLRGSDIVRGMDAIRPADYATAESRNVGGRNYASAEDAVKLGKRIKLVGTSGAMIFQNNERQMPGSSIYCIPPTAATSTELEYYVDASNVGSRCQLP